MAFVRFDKELLRPLSIWARLDVFLGGIWHNTIFSVFCALLLYTSSLFFVQLNDSTISDSLGANGTAEFLHQQPVDGFSWKVLLVFVRQLQYFVLVNLSLAGMNSLPIYSFDGQHTLAIFMSMWCRHRFYNLGKLIHSILKTGTALLALNLLFSFLNLLF